LPQIFPRWTNRLPLIFTVGSLTTVILIVFLIWYYFSPWFTDVGYRPHQPVAYSHKFHVGELGLDCRYCHVGVEESSVAMIPPTKTCMNCHILVKPESEKLAKVRESWETGIPLEWIRVHDLPDFAYFTHSPHIGAGVGCATCHGNIAAMEVVELRKPLSMKWCLDCHRDPGPHLRPATAITDMDWTTPVDQMQLAAGWIRERQINPPVECSGCHR
jgi:hypothetical protein